MSIGPKLRALTLTYLLSLLWPQRAFPHLHGHDKVTHRIHLGPPRLFHTVVHQGMLEVGGQQEGGLSKGPGLLDIPTENFRFLTDALITALSRHKDRLANLGTELNNLWHNLNI